jgi:hypothetical protein
MLKILFTVLLLTCALVSMSYARGGGADTIPMVSYTDLPPYHPTVPFKCMKSSCRFHSRLNSVRAH